MVRQTTRAGLNPPAANSNAPSATSNLHVRHMQRQPPQWKCPPPTRTYSRPCTCWPRGCGGAAQPPRAQDCSCWHKAQGTRHKATQPPAAQGTRRTCWPAGEAISLAVSPKSTLNVPRSRLLMPNMWFSTPGTSSTRASSASVCTYAQNRCAFTYSRYERTSQIESARRRARG